MSSREAILSESSETLAVIAPSSLDDDVRRPARERLESHVLKELWSIWRTDPRVPSVKSRRSWAISRDASPRLVDSWFLRRKTCAKKAGKPIPDGSYELSLDPLISPKREQSMTPIECEAIPDLPSDDTLVYPPDNEDSNDVEAFSDTVSHEDTPVEPKRTEIPAYKEVLERSRPEVRTSQPKPSSADLYIGEDRHGEVVLPLKDPSSLGKQSDCSCILCSTKPVQGTLDEVLSNSDTISDPKKDLLIPCPRLDFLPDSLSELSAIPFLFRTPCDVPLGSTVVHQSVDDWTIVEDELGRLVNDGQLDFSFLSVPHLTSMELLD